MLLFVGQSENKDIVARTKEGDIAVLAASDVVRLDPTSTNANNVPSLALPVIPNW
jgi:hypothetical protein